MLAISNSRISSSKDLIWLSTVLALAIWHRYYKRSRMLPNGLLAVARGTMGK